MLRFHKAGDSSAVVRFGVVTIDHSIELVTDATGSAKLPDLEDGVHLVELVAKGYQAFFDTFKLGPSIKYPVDFEVLPVVEPAKATPKGVASGLTLAGFEKRRAAGQAKFFTKAQLMAASGRPMGNFLKKDAGASIVDGPRGESMLGTASCLAAVVRDGLLIYPFENNSAPDLDKVFTDDLAGIEFYPRATIAPEELRESAKCGALVLWSR